MQVTSKPAMSEARDDQMLAEFRTFMEAGRGLSPATVKGCCSSVRPFLIQLLDRRRSLEKIIVSDVGSLLAEKVNEEHYARRSVRDYASSLRSFFRYAEMRGWCAVDIATSIMEPRVFQQEALPSGPTWDVVQEIETEHRRHITAKATEEIKLDGYRAIAVNSRGGFNLYSRNHNSFNVTRVHS